MPSQGDRPQKVTCSCLCGSIKFEVSFSQEYKWPPDVSTTGRCIFMILTRMQSATCQCTMCRKWTAGLLAQFIVVSPLQITPPLPTSVHYREYQSSPRRYRGFCGQCGSSLIWRSADKIDTLDVFLGVIDGRWLLGAKVEGSERRTAQGLVVERSGGLGKELCTPTQYQFYYENAIVGVTDLLGGGRKYLQENTNGSPIN